MRLFETESYVFNQKLQELTGNAEDVAVRTTIDLDRIVRVSEWASDDEDLEVLAEKCMIYIDDKTSLLIGTPYDEMISLWKGEKE